MRLYAVLVVFLLVLVAPAVVARLVATPDPHAAAARDTGDLRLDIITSHNQDIRNEFAAAFSRWHQDHYGKPVRLVYTTPGGGGDIQRLLDNTYPPNMDKEGNLKPGFRAPFDMAWGGGDRFFDRDINAYLMPADVPPDVLKAAFPDPRLAGIRLYDYKAPTTQSAKPPAPKWVGVCISSFGIVYNSDVYQRLGLELPKTWVDLTRPELASWLALANPFTSSSAAVSYSMCYQRTMADEEAALLPHRPDLAKLPPAERLKDKEFKQAVARGWKKGMGYLTLMAANAKYITDSGSQPPNDVGNGEAAAGIAIDFYGRANEESYGANRVRFLAPKGATAINPDPIAIMKGCPPDKYEIAVRLIVYLLTPEAQRLWITRAGERDGPSQRALFRPPVRRDVYDTSDRTTWTHPDINPFEDASGFNLRNEWNALFSETRLVWAVSWIDAREELKSTYNVVLGVKDKSRRDGLLAELADFPMTYFDLEALQKERAAVPANQVDLYAAKKRIELADLFRARYRAIARKATGGADVQ